MNGADERHKRQQKTVELRRVAREDALEERRRCTQAPKGAMFASSSSSSGNAMLALPQDLEQCRQMHEENMGALPVYLAYLANDVLCRQQPHIWLTATAGLRRLLSVDPTETIPAVMGHQGGVVLRRIVEGLGVVAMPQLVFESAWVVTNLFFETACANVLVELGVMPALMHLIVSTPHADIRGRCMWALRNLASGTLVHQRLVLSTGIVGLVAPMLASPEQFDLEQLEMVCGLMANLAKHRTPLEHFTAILPSVAALMHVDQSTEVARQVLAMVEYFVTDDVSPHPRVSYIFAYERGMLVQKLIKMLLHRHINVRLHALRALGQLAMGDAHETAQMHQWGVLERIRLLASSTRDARELYQTLFVVSNLAASKSDEQIGQLVHQGFVQLLINSVRKSHDDRARLEAIYALGYLAMGYNATYTRFMVESCRVCDVLVEQLGSPNCDIVYRSLTALKAILGTGDQQATAYNRAHSEVDVEQANPYVSVVRACGGFDVIEELQNHETTDVHKLASALVCKYMADED